MEIRNNKTKGFTFIELLVVVAIIALLAALAVIALNQTRVKARNSRIVGDVDEMRKLAEVIFNENDAKGYCVAGGKCLTTDPRAVAQVGDIDEQNGGQASPVVNSSENGYCIGALTADNKTVCIDATIKMKGTLFGNGTGICSGTACQ